MCSRFRSVAVVLALATSCFAATPLRVCADPDNAPFSSRRADGFENKIAEAIGAQLHRPVEFYWSRMGRGFVREVVDRGSCDVLAAVPVGMRGVLTTRPYYRSTYVFVTRRDEKAVTSFDDPRLKTLKIGVQVLDDDYAPPARALARRGITNIVGFNMDKDATEIVRAVATRKVDVAIVWGPLAGFAANRLHASLRIEPVSPAFDRPALPFTFDIAVGVRKSNRALFDEVQVAVAAAQPQIDAILREYNVPVLPRTNTSPNAGAGMR